MAESKPISGNAELASELRANGFEPVPIMPGTKQPAVSNWQHGGILVSAWGPDDGIGVLCGHSDLVAIDVDTDDPEILQTIAAALPPSCPAKRGSKGQTFFVRAKVSKKLRLPVALTFGNGKRPVQHVEVLTHGQQTLLPPSTHPDTSRPYAWVAGPDGNVRTLYAMLVDQIPTVVGDLRKLLEHALKDYALHPHLVAACERIAAASPGTRNDTLNREVFALASGQVGLCEKIAVKWVTEAARHAGLSDPEIAATFASAARAGTERRESTSQKPRLTFTLFRDIDPQPRKDWLVRDWLGVGELSCIFGKPGTGKSTIAIDLACHVAAGHAWFGRRVLQGGVLYVAAERLQVVNRRMAAFRKRHGIDDIPLAVVGGPADLRTSQDDADLIIKYGSRVVEECGAQVKLIIVETINRVLAGGDENSSVDMGRLINTLTLIQDATRAHIMAVHHSPIEGDRLRGHSSLLGALDVTIQVGASDGRYWARTEKSNDGPTGEQIGWTVESEILSQDPETGEETTAPVVVPDPIGSEQLTQVDDQMLLLLLEAEPTGLQTKMWYKKMRDKGFAVKRAATLSDAKRKLEQLGLIAHQDGFYRASPAQREKYFARTKDGTERAASAK